MKKRINFFNLLHSFFTFITAAAQSVNFWKITAAQNNPFQLLWHQSYS